MRPAPLARPFGAAYWTVHWLAFGLLWVLFKLLFRLEVKGLKRRLPAGPLLLAPNHCSFLDPLFLAVAFRRPIVFLVTSDVYTPWLRPILAFFRCIRVEEQRPNVLAVRRALAELRHGHVVGIFPEGGISRDGRIGSGSPGVASLLLQGGVPVVAVGLVGTFAVLPRQRRWPRPGKVQVHFGDVIEPREEVLGLAPRAARVALTQRVMAAIIRLLPEGQRPAAEGGGREASPARRTAS